MNSEEINTSLPETRLRNTDEHVIDSLTYVSCNGSLAPESESIRYLWKNVFARYLTEERHGSYFKNVRYERDSDKVLRPVSEIVEKGIIQGITPRTRFMAAVDSLLSDEPHVGDIEIIEKGRTYMTSYENMEKVATPEYLEKLNSVKATVTYVSPDHHTATGTKIIIDGYEMKVVEGNKRVLSIIMDPIQGKTKMIAPLEGYSGSSVSFEVDSRRAYWIILRGLLWGDKHPSSDSVRSFASLINAQNINSDQKDNSQIKTDSWLSSLNEIPEHMLEDVVEDK